MRLFVHLSRFSNSISHLSVFAVPDCIALFVGTKIRTILKRKKPQYCSLRNTTVRSFRKFVTGLAVDCRSGSYSDLNTLMHMYLQDIIDYTQFSVPGNFVKNIALINIITLSNISVSHKMFLIVNTNCSPRCTYAYTHTRSIPVSSLLTGVDC